MLNKFEIEEVAKNINLDYGDYITKKELCSLFNLSIDLSEDTVSISEYSKKSEDFSWAFLKKVDEFKTFLHLHRMMHLEATRKNFTYKVIRPEEHAHLALDHLKKHIEKGFKKCGEILDSTRVDLLTATERAVLTEAQVKSSRLKDAFGKAALKDEREPEYNNDEGRLLLVKNEF